jgi:hypothetical protein
LSVTINKSGDILQINISSSGVSSESREAGGGRPGAKNEGGLIHNLEPSRFVHGHCNGASRKNSRTRAMLQYSQMSNVAVVNRWASNVNAGVSG